MSIVNARLPRAIAVAALVALLPVTMPGAARAQAPGGVAQLAPVDLAHSHAVVVMYHRFGESQYPSTSIRLDEFEAHIKELTSGKYHVLPLPEIIAALRDKRKLPDHTVAITIDDAFESVYREAWPRLRAAHLPFTLFVATGQVEATPGEYMSWNQLRELAKAGVTIGDHSVTHAHLADQGPARVREEYAKSKARFEKELGLVPTLQAYPYGEASAKVMAAARAAGFVASFGQHSGVASDTANMDYLPRFAFNEHYGELSRFRLAVNALPLYATDVSPADPMLGPNPPAFGFTVPKNLPRIAQLACYSSQHGKLTIALLGGRRIEVRTPDAFRTGRARINCTVPAQDGRWRWFGMQFYIPRK